MAAKRILRERTELPREPVVQGTMLQILPLFGDEKGLRESRLPRI